MKPSLLTKRKAPRIPNLKKAQPESQHLLRLAIKLKTSPLADRIEVRHITPHNERCGRTGVKMIVFVSALIGIDRLLNLHSLSTCEVLNGKTQ
jgi:hypothetical protein